MLQEALFLPMAEMSRWAASIHVSSRVQYE